MFLCSQVKKDVSSPNQAQTFVNFRLQPDPKSLARLTTLDGVSEKTEFFAKITKENLICYISGTDGPRKLKVGL